VQQRRRQILAVVAVGAVFLAGLFIPGIVGAILLLAIAGLLITLSSVTWPALRSRERVMRALIVVAIVVIAVAKIAGH
jgi:hypothetical protein